MTRAILFIGLLIATQSCVPIRIAPNIKDYEITKGKKFKKSLPKRQMFIFQDPKPAHEFYNYINTKFELKDINVFDDIPFTLDGVQYFFSHYEVDIPDKTINLVPLVTDVLLQRAQLDPIMEDHYETRKGNWYIAIEVYSETENDCLEITNASQKSVVAFLQQLKKEYLATHNYNEVLFKN